MPANKKPDPIDPELIQSMSSAIPLGDYRLFSSSGQIPSALSWGGSDCRAVVIAASAYPPDLSIPDYPCEATPRGTVFLVRRFREAPSPSPVGKVDDALYFADKDGRAWSIHSKDSPDHHKHIMSASGMSTLLQDFNLPSASRGTIEDYRKGGANLDFEAPFWRK